MAEKKEIIDSSTSCTSVQEPIRPTNEPPNEKITEEPEKFTYLEEITPDESEKELYYITPAIKKALSFDLKDASEHDILENNSQLRFLLCKTIELLKEKSGLCKNLEKQIKTVELQTASLKKLVTTTKDLLSIRNIEVMNLHGRIRKMEEQINREKEKQRIVLSNLSETVKVMTRMKEENKLQTELSAETQHEYQKKVNFLEENKKQLFGQIHEEPVSEKVGEGDTQLPVDSK